jgi:hypothetical protein
VRTPSTAMARRAVKLTAYADSLGCGDWSGRKASPQSCRSYRAGLNSPRAETLREWIRMPRRSRTRRTSRRGGSPTRVGRWSQSSHSRSRSDGAISRAMRCPTSTSLSASAARVFGSLKRGDSPRASLTCRSIRPMPPPSTDRNRTPRSRDGTSDRDITANVLCGSVACNVRHRATGHHPLR